MNKADTQDNIKAPSPVQPGAIHATKAGVPFTFARHDVDGSEPLEHRVVQGKSRDGMSFSRHGTSGDTASLLLLRTWYKA